jgi:hypothetical protein
MKHASLGTTVYFNSVRGVQTYFLNCNVKCQMYRKYINHSGKDCRSSIKLTDSNKILT